MPERSKDTRRLHLHPAVIALICTYFLVVFGGLAGIAAWRDDYEILDGMFLNIVVSCAVIGLPSFIVWRLSRSNLAGNITCVAMVSLLFSCVGIGALTALLSKQQGDDQADIALEKIEEKREELRNDHDYFERLSAGEDVTQETFERIDKVRELTDEIAAQEGPDAEIYAALSATMRQAMLAAENLNRAVGEYVDAGGPDAVRFENANAIDTHINRIDHCIEQCEAYIRVYNGLASGFYNSLIRRGVPQAKATQSVESWKRGANTDLLVELKQNEVEMYRAQRHSYVYLRDHFDSWEIDEEGYLVFEDDEKLEQFSQLEDRAYEAQGEYEKHWNAYLEMVRPASTP